MNFKISAKLFTVVFMAFMFIFESASQLGAEYVFKKDGSIIKGTIVADDPVNISLKKESGGIERINRKDILRTIYTDLYLGRVYVRLTSGEVVEGVQVDEDRDNYFFRKDVTKPEEFAIPRRKVMFIARTNPTDLKGDASTEVISMTWSPPFKPAKFYKVYIRDVKEKEEKFRVAGETTDPEYTLKNLQKSWSYEIYATAISETGEESLPSEKIIVNTLPESAEKFNIAEKLSADGKSVTLTLSWQNVTDPLSRVKSYTIYEAAGNEKKKKGVSPGSEFVIKDFPAEGRHWFELVAVNDLSTESVPLRAVYDAGYKIYIRSMGTYIYPMGTMVELASYGYGGLIDIGVSVKKYSLGIETGYLMFSCESDIESMVMIPLLVELDYRIAFFDNFLFRPLIKAGGSFDMIEYIIHDKDDPLVTSITGKNNFDPMISAGAYLEWGITENINVFSGAEYSVLFQKSGRMTFANGSFGAGIIF